MIASALAYAMTAFFVFFGFAFMAVSLQMKTPPATTAALCFLAIVFFAAAWGCAFLGGI